MKNKVKILFVLLLLTSCGGNQTSNSINTSNDSSTSETTTSTKQNVSLNLKNIVDGDVKDATFKVNDQEITSRYQDNTYYLDNVPLNSILGTIFEPLKDVLKINSTILQPEVAPVTVHKTANSSVAVFAPFSSSSLIINETEFSTLSSQTLFTYAVIL